MLFTVTLNGASEQPTPVTTAATATVAVTLDASNNVTVNGSFVNLTSNATVAHIHGPASATGTASPIASVPLTVTAATAGAVMGSGTLTAQQRGEMISGMTYLNIHSANFPNGEIRGQIQ